MGFAWGGGAEWGGGGRGGLEMHHGALGMQLSLLGARFGPTSEDPRTLHIGPLRGWGGDGLMGGYTSSVTHLFVFCGGNPPFGCGGLRVCGTTCRLLSIC